MDTEYTDFPICPHCGHRHRDVWEWDFGAGIEGATDKDCDQCNKPFFVAKFARITYTTKALRTDAENTGSSNRV